MKYKQIIFTLLGLFLVAFLTSGCVDSKKMKLLQNEVTKLSQVIQQKDVEISTLTAQSQIKQKELDSIKNELDSTKKELDSSKKELDSVKKELDSVNKKLNTLTATPVVPKK
jgi:peptidoglycan hydrolase CwlO-like protein